MNPARIVAIPGNHDKLLRTRLDIYDSEFTGPLGIQRLEMQRSEVIIRHVGRRDFIFILVDANAYASTPAEIGANLRNHVACGIVSEELAIDVRDKLRNVRLTAKSGEDALRTTYEQAIKVLVIHYAVDLRRVSGFSVSEMLIPHGCEGIGELVSMLKQDFGLDLVVHGHLHKPALYTHDGVPVVACTTTTQQYGRNGFHLLKSYDSGEIHAEYHAWRGSAFVRDDRRSLTRRLLPV